MEPENYGEYADDVQEEDRQLAFNTSDVSLNHSKGRNVFFFYGDDAALSLRVFLL